MLLPIIHLYSGTDLGTVVTREEYLEFVENLHDIGYEIFMSDGRYDGVSILKDTKSLTPSNEGLEKMKKNLIMAWDVQELSESLSISIKEAIKRYLKKRWRKEKKA